RAGPLAHRRRRRTRAHRRAPHLGWRLAAVDRARRRHAGRCRGSARRARRRRAPRPPPDGRCAVSTRRRTLAAVPAVGALVLTGAALAQAQPLEGETLVLPPYYAELDLTGDRQVTTADLDLLADHL